MRSGKSDIAEMQAWADVARLDVTIVDAKDENQKHLSDEQQAEKKGEPAQGFLSTLFKREVVNLIDESAEYIERRQHHDAHHDGIDPELDIDDIGDVGSENDERRMGDVHDVEHAEGNRNASRDCGVESAEQKPRDNRVHQQIEGNIHTRLNRLAAAMHCQTVRPNDARPRSAIELPALLPSEALRFYLSHSNRPAATDFAAVCRKPRSLASLLNDQPKLCKCGK
jgi:hypothetical protein